MKIKILLFVLILTLSSCSASYEAERAAQGKVPMNMLLWGVGNRRYHSPYSPYSPGYNSRPIGKIDYTWKFYNDSNK